MKNYSGIGVSSGIAIGHIHVLRREAADMCLEQRGREDELDRFSRAKSTALSALDSIYAKTAAALGEDTAAIFEIHKMMLEDDDFTESIIRGIKERGLCAEQSVRAAQDKFSALFSGMDDEYMRARSEDVHSIAQNLLEALTKEHAESKERSASQDAEPVILFASELSPSDTMKIDKSRLLGFVSVFGSEQSHASIIARTLGLPMLVGVEPPPEGELDGKPAIIDGSSGTLIIEPDEESYKIYRKRQAQEQEAKRRMRDLIGKQSVTLDGQRVSLCANIGSISDIGLAAESDAEGIGLFRSEFIYLGSSDYPTEEEQLDIYKKVLEGMPNKRVIIRTLDIGADKQAEYFGLEQEANPALGLRAIRICLTRPELFKTQLRALYRSSVYGDLAIMYPMITSVDEVCRIKQLSAEVRAELLNAGIPYRKVEEGIMIETPAAALVSSELAREVDFFSVGTNDLSQYTLAMDRQNHSLDQFFRRDHPAILRLIEISARNAHANGIRIGICGELAADISLTEAFLRMGIDELSMSPSRILEVREKVRSLRL